MKKILTIAGSDCSGGAGIQADIKTIVVHKAYAMSVITALTAQNTLGVKSIINLEAKFISEQLDAVFKDIYPDAIKIGMIGNQEIIRVIKNKLREYKAKNIIIDPVMKATSGSELISRETQKELINILGLAKIITPNIYEAEILCDFKINNTKDIKRAGKKISREINTSVLIKGGDFENNNYSIDYLFVKNKIFKFYIKRVKTQNTHGTGCTLSSAIACNIAHGKNLIQSVRDAKNYLTGALNAKLNLGHGCGPVDHSYCLEKYF